MGFIEKFFMYFIQDCFISRPSDSTVSEDAGIEPRTVATSAIQGIRWLAGKTSGLPEGSKEVGWLAREALASVQHVEEEGELTG